MTESDTVVVVGQAHASARPDRYVVDLRLETHGPTVADALDALTTASRACHDLLPAQVSTHGLGLHPYHRNDGTRAGHTAYQSLRVVADDPTGAGSLVARLGEAVGDALAVEGLRPETTDPAGLQARAREAAWVDARRRAQEHAQLAGRRLGDVLRVSETAPGRPEQARDMRMMAMAGGPQVQPEDLEVIETVEVTWTLV